MPEYARTSMMPVSPGALFAYLAAPGSFARAQPPWVPLRNWVEPPSLTEGASFGFESEVGSWSAHRLDIRDTGPTTFTLDAAVGPLAGARHIVRALADRRTGDRHNPGISVLDDHLTYAEPGGLSRAARAIVRDLDRRFIHRHARTRLDLVRQQSFADRPRLRIVVSGASGLIGTALCAFLTSAGHRVDALVRRPPAPHAGGAEIRWDPAAGEIDAAALEGCDAIIHLAGATLNRSWSRRTKEEIRASRVESTALLVRTIAGLSRKPAAFISSSAIGYYGDRGVEPLLESSTPGEGFLADLCVAWEQAAMPAADAGVRVVLPRIGIVLTPRGGALAELEPKFRVGLGGRLGGGFQFWPWIGLDDTVGALHWCLMRDDITGPVNLAAPGAVRQFEFAQTFADVLDARTLANVPEWVVKAAFGEMGREVLLRGTNVVPGVLERTGFTFLTPGLEQCLRWEMGLLLPTAARG